MNRFIPVLALLLAGGAASAQNLYSQRAQIDSAYAADHYPAGTTEGISQAELQEYARLAQPGTGLFEVQGTARRERMMALFGRMSRAQQLRQRYVFVRPVAPPEVRSLDEKQLREFADPARYTVLVDGAVITPGQLAAFRAEDFAAWQRSDVEMKPRDDAPFTRKVYLYTRALHERMLREYDAHKDRFDQLQVQMGVPRAAR